MAESVSEAHEIELQGHLDVRRMACISLGKPSDHAEDVVVVPDPEFDIEGTIFKTMDIPEIKGQLSKNLGVKVYWSDASVAKTFKLYSRVPPPMPHDRSLMDFIQTECEFNVEHADGSFMDHLKFCYDYSAIHLKGHSPTPLFLHSIMGTGTNVFPMDISKIPQLAALLTPQEMAQVEAFPSILRLLHTFTLQEALQANADNLDKMKGITFHRCIDNKPCFLSMEQLWVQLNYQLIHELDFLPLANWSETAASGSFQTLRSLHDMLIQHGKLEAYVDLDVSCSGPSGSKLTLREAMAARPTEAMQKERDGFVWFHQYFSNKIGHSLDFELNFHDQSRL